jgi:hypothetical protein
MSDGLSWSDSDEGGGMVVRRILVQGPAKMALVKDAQALRPR